MSRYTVVLCVLKINIFGAEDEFDIFNSILPHNLTHKQYKTKTIKIKQQCLIVISDPVSGQRCVWKVNPLFKWSMFAAGIVGCRILIKPPLMCAGYSGWRCGARISLHHWCLHLFVAAGVCWPAASCNVIITRWLQYSYYSITNIRVQQEIE